MSDWLLATDGDASSTVGKYGKYEGRGTMHALRPDKTNITGDLPLAPCGARAVSRDEPWSNRSLYFALAICPECEKHASAFMPDGSPRVA